MSYFSAEFIQRVKRTDTTKQSSFNSPINSAFVFLGKKSVFFKYFYIAASALKSCKLSLIYLIFFHFFFQFFQGQNRLPLRIQIVSVKERDTLSTVHRTGLGTNPHVPIRVRQYCSSAFAFGLLHKSWLLPKERHTLRPTVEEDTGKTFFMNFTGFFGQPVSHCYFTRLNL